MAEIEIHHETEAHDGAGKVIGVAASLIGVLLALVTILSHRAHTQAVLLKADANDKWTYYQAKRIKFHNLELGEDLIAALGAKGPEAGVVLGRYGAEKSRYEKEAEETQAEAREIEKKSARVEGSALRFDFGEGLLEVALILTSLYFIARSKLLPAVGAVCAVAGLVTAVSGYLV
jgi:hypothetical protein